MWVYFCEKTNKETKQTDTKYSKILQDNNNYILRQPSLLLFYICIFKDTDKTLVR